MTQSSNSRAASREAQDRNEQALLSAVIQRIGNPPWDLLVIGDGSGSGWNEACGWACTLISNHQQLRRFFYGAMDCGSINLAEAMPYLQSLTWYDVHHGKERLKALGYLRVHILTDSQVTANWGNQAMSGEYAEPPRKLLAFYAGIRELRRVGYHCTFHWAKRLTTELNWAADLIAGLSRKEIIKAGNPAYVSGADHAARAANALGNMVFYDPHTGDALNPYLLNPVNTMG